MQPISAKYKIHDTMISSITGEHYNYIDFTIRLPNKNEQRVRLRADDDYTQVLAASIEVSDKLFSSLTVELWMSALLSSWKNRTNEMVRKDLYTFVYGADKVDCVIKGITEDLESDFEKTKPSETLLQKVTAQYGSFFKSDVPNIAFYPINSYPKEQFAVVGYDEVAVIFLSTMYATAAVGTMLCAAALAVLAGLLAPIALGGAALVDLLDAENEDPVLGM